MGVACETPSTCARERGRRGSRGSQCCAVHGQSGTVCRVSSRRVQGVRRGGDRGDGGQRRAHPTRAPGQPRAAGKGGVAHVRNLEGLR